MHSTKLFASIDVLRSNKKIGSLGTLLAAVDGRLGAPLGRQTPHPNVDVLVESQQVADDAVVQQGAIGVSIGQECGHQLLVTKLVEDILRSRELPAHTADTKEGAYGLQLTLRTSILKISRVYLKFSERRSG